MKEKLILIGAGGHAKSVADSVDTDRYEIVGFLDYHKTGSFLGLPIFGVNIEDIPNPGAYKFFVSIGDIAARKMWFERLLVHGLDVVNIIDPTAVISKSARIGIGNFIGKYAILNAEAIIGDDNIINTKALVEHECVVGSHTHLSTNSAINGNVIVGDGVFFGSCAVSNGQLRIGEGAIVGSGSVVIRDVEAYTTVVGVPARVIKQRTV